MCACVAVIEGNCSGNVTHGWATHGADVGFLEGGSIYYTSNGTERGMTSAGFKDCNQTDEEVALSDREAAAAGLPPAANPAGARQQQRQRRFCGHLHQVTRGPRRVVCSSAKEGPLRGCCE